MDEARIPVRTAPGTKCVSGCQSQRIHGYRDMQNTYSGRMPNTRIVPNSSRPFSPVHTSNAVVIVCDEAHDVLADHSVFKIVHAVDASYVQTDASKDALPAGLTIRPHYGMRRSELVTDV